MRELASYDPVEYDAIGDRDLREALLGYEAIVRARTAADFRHVQLIEALAGPGKGKRRKPLDIPKLLLDDE